MFEVGQKVKVTSLDWGGHFETEGSEPENLLGEIGTVTELSQIYDQQANDGTTLGTVAVEFDNWIAKDLGCDAWWFLESQLEIVGG